MEITPQVQNWINNSDNDFAQSLRVQQRRGRVLSEKQIAVAARLSAQAPVAVANSRHLGVVGQIYVLQARLVSSEWSPRAGVTVNKFIANADDELVYFGRKPDFIEVGQQLAIQFKVKQHSEFRGLKSTVIHQLETAQVLAPAFVETTQQRLVEDAEAYAAEAEIHGDVAVAQQVLQRFTLTPAAPVAQPVQQAPKPVQQAVNPFPYVGSTPFGDFAKQIKGE